MIKNKKVLAILILVCFMFTMMPVAVWAEDAINTTNENILNMPVAVIGSTTYSSIQAAVNAANDGDTIVVTADHKIDGNATIAFGNYETLNLISGKAVTIDINGKKIYCEADGTYESSAGLVGFFTTYDDGHLTLVDNIGTGEIRLDATEKVYGLLVNFDDESSITVKSGSYVLDKAGDSLIYSGGSKCTIIEGGTYHLGNIGTGVNGSPWMFNASGQNTKHIIVKGGTFNTDINHQYYPFEVEVPREKALRNNGDGTWTIVDAVAYVNEQEKSGNWYTREVGYASLEEAMSKIDDFEDKNRVDDEGNIHIVKAEYITLLTDCELSADIEKPIIIDGQGKELTITKNITLKEPVTISGDLKIVADSGIEISSNSESDIISSSGEAKLEILGGRYGFDINPYVPEEVKENIKEENGMWEIIPFKISWNVDGNIKQENYLYGEKITRPNNPKKIGHTFVDWYTDASCTTLYDFDASVTGDITLYAKWDINQYTVKFDVDGTISTTSAAYGYSINAPANPEKIGHTFAGWYTDDSYVTPYDFDTPVTGDITLYAKWNKNNYTVKFDVDGDVSESNVVYGELVNAPETAEKVCQEFVGWYIGNTKTDFPYTVTNNVVFKAKWNESHVDLDGKYTADATHHWKTCDCGNVIDKAKHVYDSSADALCNICSYERTISSPTHSSSGTVYVKPEKYETEVVLQIDSTNVYVDGQLVNNDAAPILVGDRTLVPIRIIIEQLGGIVEWDNETRTVTLTLNDEVMKMTINQIIPDFDAAPIIIENRTYVPIRYIMERVGAEVDWIDVEGVRRIVIKK